MAAGKLAVFLVALLGFDGLDELAVRWDGGHFISIAENGYRELHDTVFAPLYPLLVRLAAGLGVELWAAALVVANVASLALAVVLCRLYGLLPALVVASFPTMQVYTAAAYSEAVALPLLALGLLLALRSRWGSSAFSLLAAGLARYQYTIYAVLLAGYAMARRMWRQAAIMVVAAVATASIAVTLWYAVTGDPLAYIHAEKLWDAKLSAPFIGQAGWLLSSWFSRTDWPLPLPWGYARVEPWMWLARNLVLYALYAAGAVALAYERRLIEAAWSISTILFVASLTGVPAVSTPRLLLPAFPALAALAQKVSEHPGEVRGIIFASYAAFSIAVTGWLAAWHLSSFFG